MEMVRNPNKEEKQLTDQAKAFIEEYCTGAISGRPLRIERAARAVGYSEPRYGYQLIRDPRVKRAIEERLKENVMSAQEVSARLSEIARGEVGEMVDTTGPLPKLDMSKLDAIKHLIKSFTYDSNGNPKIEFHDAHAALRDLMKIHGLSKEGLEISGPGGGAVPLALNVNFVAPRRADDQLALEAGDE